MIDITILERCKLVPVKKEDLLNDAALYVLASDSGQIRDVSMRHGFARVTSYGVSELGYPYVTLRFEDGERTQTELDNLRCVVAPRKDIGFRGGYVPDARAMPYGVAHTVKTAPTRLDARLDIVESL